MNLKFILFINLLLLLPFALFSLSATGRNVWFIKQRLTINLVSLGKFFLPQCKRLLGSKQMFSSQYGVMFSKVCGFVDTLRKGSPTINAEQRGEGLQLSQTCI